MLRIVGSLLYEFHQSRMFLRFYEPWVIAMSREECRDRHCYFCPPHKGRAQ